MRGRARSGLTPREAQVKRETRRLDCIEAGTHTWDNAGAGIDGGDRCIKCGGKVDRPERAWNCSAEGHLYEMGDPKCVMCGTATGPVLPF